MKTVTKFVCVMLFTVPLLATAQQKISSAWSAKFKSPVNWQRVHALGYLIVSNNDGLYGVNPADGKILWENKGFPALPPDNFQEVPGTEFAAIAYKTNASSTIPMQAIVHVISGKVLFDSQKESIGVLSRHVLPSAGKLLVIGMRPKNLVASLFMYDIATGQQVWANDDLFKAEKPAGNTLLSKLQAMGEEMSSLQALTSEPYELDNSTMLLTHPNYIMKIKSNTGEVVWKNKIEQSKKAQVYFSSYKPGIVYIGTDVESTTGSGFTTSSGNAQQSGPQKFYYNLYYAYDLNTGASLWKKPAKESDLLNQVIPHEKGLIICPRSSQKPTINLVNYETGETVWGKKGKGIKAEGSVVSYIPTPAGILITTAFDNAWNTKAEEYYLNVLDPVAGALKYEKSVKLKGDLVRSEMTPKGLLFITTKEVNILDTNTGTLAWSASIEAGNPFNSDNARPFPTGDNKAGKLFVYSPKEKAVFEVDKQGGTSKKITTAKVEFEGKEMPRSIDVVSDGIVMTSEQNIMKLGFDGLVKYYKYYPAPREPALMRALLAAEAIRAAYIGAAAGLYSAAFAQAADQSQDPAGKAVGQEFSKGFASLSNAGFAYSSAAMKQFNARYKASMTAPNFMMMMTKQEKRGNQLIQVSKTNGDIVNAIDIKNDKEPEYEVDQIFNHIYYRPNASEIVCYKLN
ncbi:MAG TPA: PQQ-binding-like beta-propeller repeat protein [Chryseosolibacter sp.]|nr:PQQ-binding-like beta-propeller repeat protein [Chryseosolibacter sp.]